jgi:hypothetical protein
VSLLCAGAAAAQTTTAPMKSVLAGKKLTPPARGEVTVEYTSPVRKNVKDVVITTFQVKNIGLSPIARLTITQTWFDKSNNIVGGGKGEVPGLFQPGEVKTVTIEAPYKPSFNGDSFNFAHANGTVKPKAVAKLVPNTPGTTTASTTTTAKEPAAKKAAAKK